MGHRCKVRYGQLKLSNSIEEPQPHFQLLLGPSHSDGCKRKDRPLGASRRACPCTVPIFMTPPNAQRSMPDRSGRVPAFVPRLAATRPRLLRDSYCSRSATPPFASLARSTVLLRSPTLSNGAVLQVNRISAKPHCRSGSINIEAIQVYRHKEKANQGSGPAKVGNFHQGSHLPSRQHREIRPVTGPLPKRPPAEPIRCAPKPKKRHFYDRLD